jgi:peptidoglycan/LPS O-acetylase OafA/YrhL
MIGLVNYRLPGVFENNPVQLVNLSLWTVPFEMGCYAIMSAFIVFGMLRRPGLVVCLLCLYILIGLLVSLSGLKLSDIASQIARAFAGRGSRLYVAFVLGILAFLVRYHLPYSGRVFAACVIVCGFVTLIGPGHSFPMLNALLALPLVYITVVIGCTHVPMPKFLNRNDLSYGIYLYGMPIQQVMVDQFPSVTSPSQQFALALPPTLIFAGLSWRFVERPIANLRKRFSFVAKIRIADTNT